MELCAVVHESSGYSIGCVMSGVTVVSKNSAVAMIIILADEVLTLLSPLVALEEKVNSAHLR